MVDVFPDREQHSGAIAFLECTPMLLSDGLLAGQSVVASDL